jgi:hypothetical protein
MKKQTAVEWLESEFIKLESTTGVYANMYDLIEEAKEMEKEQIEDAYGDGLNAHRTNFCNREEYYNKIYKTI